MPASTLTAEQLEQYRTDGYLVVRGIFSEVEAVDWREECSRILRLGIADQFNLRTHPHFVTPDVWIVDRVEPVIDISEKFKALAQSETLKELLRPILNDRPRLFKDKLVYKMVGTPGYGIHQDYSWWQEFPTDLINVMVAIDEADRTNGALEFFPGRHNKLLVDSPNGRNFNRVEATLLSDTIPKLIETSPGDLVLFHSLLPHRSGPNTSASLRRQLYLTYSGESHGDFYKRQLAILHAQRPSRGPNADRPNDFYFR